MTSAQHFTTGLPTKRVAADCLIFDTAGRFLVVEPTYKTTWDVPGGVAETDESPRLAAKREIAEELGLEVEPGALLAVDWISSVGAVTEVVAFLFDGGVVEPPVGGFTLQADEIRRTRFVKLADAKRLMAPAEFSRVEAGLVARERQSALYLESGRPIDLLE
jgi:8-oxo-dGTP diphosphatase